MVSKNTSKITDIWPSESSFRRSIRFEFGAYIGVLMLVVMVITGYVMSNQYAQSSMQAFIGKLLAEARSFSGSAGKLIISESGPDALLLSNICRKLTQSNDEVYWAAVTDKNGEFLAHTDIQRVTSGARMQGLPSTGFAELLREGESCYLTEDTVIIVVPINEQQITLGTLAVAASADAIAEAQRAAITTVSKITLAMILIGIPLTVLLLHRKLKPLTTITRALRAVEPGDIHIDIPIKSRNEFGYLAQTLHVMGGTLNRAQKEMIESERIARELEIARQIQARILPQSYPQGRWFEFAGAYKSAKEVGGDYYDFILYDDGRVGFVVADVSGKSLPGMMLMLLTRDLFRQLSPTIADPVELLARINQELLANTTQGMFVTMFFGIFDGATCQFRFASAGHNPLLVFRTGSGTCESLKTRGFPLGMVPDAQFRTRLEESQIKLVVGDALIQYTDGINEALNAANEEYTLERLTERVQALGRQTPERMVSGILNALNEFVGTVAQYDDQTLLVMKCLPSVADSVANGKLEGELYAK